MFSITVPTAGYFLLWIKLKTIKISHLFPIKDYFLPVGVCFCGLVVLHKLVIHELYRKSRIQTFKSSKNIK